MELKQETIYTVSHRGLNYRFSTEDRARAFMSEVLYADNKAELVKFLSGWKFNTAEELANLILTYSDDLNDYIDSCQ